MSSRTADYFTRAASDFDALYANESRAPRWINRTFRRDIYERFRLTLEHVGRYLPESILDVGCGPGRYEAAIAQLGIKRIQGIDVSPAMLDIARQTAPAAEFVQQDFAAFGSSERFDVVVAMGFFDYSAKPADDLAHMKEIAKHSIVASFPSVNWYRTPIRKVRYFLKNCPVRFYSRRDIELLAAPFRKSEIIKIPGAGQDYFAAFYL
ncbi:MAG TPA: class I SAM-dependent methyltransferase [Candidatus Angelobacter sp.]|nr:class I SAM-dependent methyltransferase [Candidatus Angelobacter sp.]